jgi:hypothetical protein
MKKRKRKLALTSEAVAHLTSVELRHVAGGVTGMSNCVVCTWIPPQTKPPSA